MPHSHRFCTVLFLVLFICFQAVAQNNSQTTPPDKDNSSCDSKLEQKKKATKLSDVREVYFDGLLRYPPRPPACAINGQVINMLVIGDSIMWGQGLREDQKISYRVQEWLCTQTRRPVRLWREAHSGAVLEIGEPVLPEATAVSSANVASDIAKQDPQEAKRARASKSTVGANPAALELHGEVNVDAPTIPAQLDRALTYLKPEEIHLVLMDGCINDFGVFQLLDPRMTTKTIDQTARAVCYDRMKRFLQKAIPRLPNARFIVTGYYPIITEKSATNVLYRAIFGALLSEGERRWLFPSAKKALFKDLINNSREFGTITNRYLQQSVDEAGGTSGRISFVPVYYEPDSPFGTPCSGFAAPKKTSLLWTSRLNATGRGGLNKALYVMVKLPGFAIFKANDQVYPDRGKACDLAGLKKLSFPGLKCRLAAFGHPNTKGVDVYVNRVKLELQRLLGKGDWLNAEVVEGN